MNERNIPFLRKKELSNNSSLKYCSPYRHSLRSKHFQSRLARKQELIGSWRKLEREPKKNWNLLQKIWVFMNIVPFISKNSADKNAQSRQVARSSKYFYNKNHLYCTYASEASSSLIKASLTGGRSCLMFRPLTYGADSLSVSFNCPQNKRDTW